MIYVSICSTTPVALRLFLRDTWPGPDRFLASVTTPRAVVMGLDITGLNRLLYSLYHADDASNAHATSSGQSVSTSGKFRLPKPDIALALVRSFK